MGDSMEERVRKDTEKFLRRYERPQQACQSLDRPVRRVSLVASYQERIASRNTAFLAEAANERFSG